MKIRILCALSCLAGALTPPAVLAQTDSGAQTTKATITVPGKDVVFYSSIATPPDAYGGFQIEIRLPQNDIGAENCGGSGLAVDMPEVDPKIASKNMESFKNLVKKQVDYYDILKALSRENKLINIAILVDQKSLIYSKGKLFSPWCNVVFSGFEE